VGGPVRSFYIEQMFVSVRMQFHKHADTQPVKRFDRTMRYICDIKFGMLQVRKNEISLHKCSGGSAQLRSLEGALVTAGDRRDLIATTVNLNRKLGYIFFYP